MSDGPVEVQGYEYLRNIAGDRLRQVVKSEGMLPDPEWESVQYIEPLVRVSEVNDRIDEELEKLEDMGHKECACVTAEEVLKRVKNSLNSGGEQE